MQIELERRAEERKIMDTFITVTIIAAGIVPLVVIGMVISIYQRCPPNKAMIVYGGFGSRVIKSGGCPVWPMIEQRSYLSLEVMAINVRCSAPRITKPETLITAEGAALVKVMGDEDSIKTAAEQFLGKSDQEISELVHQVLIGHLRNILSTIQDEQLKQLDALAVTIQEKAIPDLAKMGVTTVSFTIKDIKHDHNPIAENDELSELKETVRDLKLRVAELETRAALLPSHRLADI